MGYDSSTIVVIGGGIAGLAAAGEAEKTSIDYVLLEANSTVGGLTRSIYVDNYTFDYTGHLLHLSHYDSPDKLCRCIDPREWIQLDRNSKCYFAGRLIDAPLQYNLGILPEGIKVRFWNDYIVAVNEGKAGASTENFKEYLQSNFGAGLANEFLIPYNEKILATDLERISGNAVTRFFPQPDKDKMRAGMQPVGERREKVTTYNSKFWYPRTGGMQKLVDALVAEVHPKKIMTKSRIVDIDIDSKRVFTERGEIQYEILLSSMPVKNLISLAGIRKRIGDMEFNEVLSASSVLCIHLGIRGQLFEELKGVHWIYFAQPELPFYRMGVYSNFTDEMVSKGSYSYYIEIGLSDKELEKGRRLNMLYATVDALEELGWLKSDNIDVTVMNLIRYGYVHYTHKREIVLDRLSSILGEYSIFLLGRYGRWHYCSMEDSILDGRMLVQKLLKNWDLCG